MTTYHCRSVAEFERVFRRNMTALVRRIERGIRQTASDAVVPIRANAPKAFGDLRRSVHRVVGAGSGAVVAITTVDAPHAAAVEEGSRPHVVPLDALVKWVKLRGMQGLTSRGRLKAKYGMPSRVGVSTERHARQVARQLRNLERGGALEIDAPTRIAKAIQKKIAEHGTRPFWFVKKSMPAIMTALDANMKDAVNA